MINILKKIYVPAPFASWASLCWIAFVTYTSTKPSPKIAGINQSFLDHLLNFSHLPVYFVMTMLLIFAFGSFKIRYLSMSVLIAVLVGIFNEFIQLYVPGRSFSIKDMLMNGAGALLAALFLLWVNNKPS